MFQKAKGNVVMIVGVFAILFIFSFSIFGQRATAPIFSFGGGFSSSNYTPFWLRANQFGAVPTEENYVHVGGSTYIEYRKGKKMDWGFGASGRLNLGETKADLLVQEAYLKGKWGIFELSAGRKKYIQGLMDSTLSSGSFAFSGNALPMPKVEIVVNEYWHPDFLGGYLGFKGNFVHALFDNKRSDVDHIFLHQKSFYGRLGKPNSLFKFYGGFNHQVQWGGTLKYADPTNQASRKGKVASSLKDYLYVITGQSMAAAGGDTAKYGYNDAYNRLGNHLGTVDVGMEIDGKFGKVFFYRQSIYEDGSLFYGNNITDGLHGVAFSTKRKQGLLKLVFEYFNTTSQGGAGGSGNTVGFLRGQDNYLNNSVYREGWTYLGRGLGSPLMTLDAETDLNAGKDIFYDNNRIETFYVGAEAMIGENRLMFRGSLSNAIGRYGSEYIPVKKQIALGLQWQRQIFIFGQDAFLSANIGADMGSWKKDLVGANFTLSVPLQ
jgi:hypothetical protein